MYILITDPNQYLKLQPFYTGDKVLLRSSIDQGDLNQFTALTVECGASLHPVCDKESVHKEHTTLNGHPVFLDLEGNSEHFGGVRLYLLTHGKVIDVLLHNYKGHPLPGLTTQKTNLFSLIEDTIYGQVIASLKIH